MAQGGLVPFAVCAYLSTHRCVYFHAVKPTVRGFTAGDAHQIGTLVLSGASFNTSLTEPCDEVFLPHKLPTTLDSISGAAGELAMLLLLLPSV
jgi:hypothetical protein